MIHLYQFEGGRLHAQLLPVAVGAVAAPPPSQLLHVEPHPEEGGGNNHEDRAEHGDRHGQPNREAAIAAAGPFSIEVLAPVAVSGTLPSTTVGHAYSAAFSASEALGCPSGVPQASNKAAASPTRGRFEARVRVTRGV